MAWVVSKIIGDGLSTDTAFRTAAQQYGITILNANHIPVNTNTGAPVAAFALLQIDDADAPLLSAEPGAYVIPNVVAPNAVTKAQITNNLSAQACAVSINTATSTADIVNIVQANINAAANAVKVA